MVPCQPRQLVIFSLPFAALVAFFWYKRRKSLSRSDPGGTLEPRKTVDEPAEPRDTLERYPPGGQTVQGVERIAPPKVEEDIVAKKIGQILSSPPKSVKIVDEPNISAKSEKPLEGICDIEKKSIVCNGTAIPIKDKLDVVSIVKQELNSPTTPDFECKKIFHSTIIDDEKDLEDVAPNSVLQDDQPVEELLQEVETVDEVECNTCIENKVDKVTLTDKTKNLTIPLEEQSTVENFALRDLVIENTETEQTADNSVESETDNKTVDKVQDESSDTGFGSQDLSQDSSTGMAQGQETKGEEESNGAGLEHKLASLGLDTQTAAQRAERDSANHSPAEVMLNSPAISTFSDAHSEGSSDSGKGCSDVVTPPSRTPAGGSSVAGDQVPSVFEFVLPQVIVGRLIGRHGAFLHDIRAKTHTNVFIKRHPETNSLKICAIEGTQQDIDAALKMIRQKFPLRRFPDLTLEKVSFVKDSCLPISPENLQLHLVDGVNNDVILSSLITAGHFFLQLPSHLSYQSLYRLACIMNSVYNTQESPPLPDPQPDVVCVAPAHGGWYRAQILSVDEEAHTSSIRFLDYGGFLTVDNSLLRQIRGDFLLLPFQAVECALANVVPAGGEEEWSEEAKQLVQLMTTHQTLQAQVYEYTETGLPLVYLYCNQFYQNSASPSGFESRVVLLNQELVSRGFADVLDSWQDDGEGQTTSTESS